MMYFKNNDLKKNEVIRTLDSTFLELRPGPVLDDLTGSGFSIGVVGTEECSVDFR
jgi:hypothetical protein